MKKAELRAQESGISWIGRVPAHWTVKCLKHIALFQTGWTPPTGDAASYVGTNLWATIGDLGERVIARTKNCISDGAVEKAGIRLTPKGSLLFSFKLSVGQVSIAAQPMYTNEAIASFLPQDGFHTPWAFYAFPEFIVRNSEINIYGAKLLNRQRINDAVLPVPPIEEQVSIASYLDIETARIDALINEKSSLIKLLREQSVMVAESVIAPAVDGRQAKLGYFVNLLPGFAFPSESFSSNESDVPLLRGVNVAPGSIRWEDNVYWPKDQCSGLDRFRLLAGDVVFGMDRPWISSGARVALIDALSEGSFLLQRVCRVRGEEEISNRFIYYILGSDKFRQSVEFELSGVSVPHISPEQITRFKIPVLTVDEQERRCNDADEEIRRINDLVEVAERMTDALKELRSATITDAVLGRIDVCSTFQNKKELEAA